MNDVSVEAIDAGHAAIDWRNLFTAADNPDTQEIVWHILRAARPLIVTAERERIAQAIEGRGAICRIAHGDECIGFAAYQDAASTARIEVADHVHRWVDARNTAVLSGEVCPDCGDIRPGNTRTEGDPA